MMEWQRLDKNQSNEILEHISSVSGPNLFSPSSSEARFKPLSFYQNYMIYRITNYATLPSFSLDFLSDGESFHLLDGSPAPINIVNALGSLYLTESNVIDYVDFYLTNIHGEDGDIYLIRDAEKLPFLDSLSLDQQIELKQKHASPTVTIDKETGDLVVLADLFYDGTLLKAAILTNANGNIEIKPSNMIMSAHKDDTNGQAYV